MKRTVLIFSVLLCSASFLVSQPTAKQNHGSDTLFDTTDALHGTHGQDSEIMPTPIQSPRDTVEDDSSYEESIQQEPIPRSVSPMDSIPTSGSEAKQEYYDTLSSPPAPDTAMEDTIEFLPDTLDTAAGERAEALSQLDTTINVWDNPFWAIGLGWSLGGMQLFDTWQEGLPDSSVTFSYQSDSLTRAVSVKEDFPSYHNTFPITLQYHVPSDSLRSMAVAISAYTIGKRFEAEWVDSGVTYREDDHRLRLWYFDIGADYFIEIPTRFFDIDGVDRTMFTLGASFAPLPVITYERRIQGAAVSRQSEQSTFIGRGVSWRAGLSAMRQVAMGRGIEINLLYQGSWMGGFKDGDLPLRAGRLDPNIKDSDENYSFLTHRFVLYFRFIFGKSYKLELPL